MIVLDLTEQVITLEHTDDSSEGILTIINGFNPDSGVESVHVIKDGERTELEANAGAGVRGTGISRYSIRERVLCEPGHYEIEGQPRKGNEQRKLIVHLEQDDDLVRFRLRPGSSPATWIIGSQDPLRTTSDSKFTANFEGSYDTLETNI